MVASLTLRKAVQRVITDSPVRLSVRQLYLVVTEQLQYDFNEQDVLDALTSLSLEQELLPDTAHHFRSDFE